MTRVRLEIVCTLHSAWVSVLELIFNHNRHDHNNNPKIGPTFPQIVSMSDFSIFFSFLSSFFSSSSYFLFLSD